MSITDELRERAHGFHTFNEELLLAIADRIDAEHERQLDVLYRDMSDAEWVRLPKDADGVPIHVGDVMEYADKPTEPLTVSYIELEEKGWWVFAGGMGRRPDKYRHHRAPTVEDVLRELLDEAEHFHSLEEEREAIAEYAAKLRLAEGEDV